MCPREVKTFAHKFWRLQRHQVPPQIRTARRESGRTLYRRSHSLCGALLRCRSKPTAWDGHDQQTLRQNVLRATGWSHDPPLQLLLYGVGQRKWPEVGPQASLYPVAPGTLFHETRAAPVLTEDTFKVCTALLSTDTDRDRTGVTFQTLNSRMYLFVFPPIFFTCPDFGSGDGSLCISKNGVNGNGVLGA